MYEDGYAADILSQKLGLDQNKMIRNLANGVADESENDSFSISDVFKRVLIGEIALSSLMNG